MDDDKEDDKRGSETFKIVPTGSEGKANESRDKTHTEENLQQKLLRQEDELRLLRGKIKGYQTLGSLYQETRLEVSNLKAKLVEVQHQGQSTTDNLSLSSLKQDRPSLKEDKPMLRFDLNQQEPLSQMQEGATPFEPGTSPSEQSYTKSEQTSLPSRENMTKKLALVSLADDGDTDMILKQQPPSPPTSNDLSTNSSSYKVINSDDNSVNSSSMVSGMPGEDWNILGEQPLMGASNRASKKVNELVPSLSEEPHLREELPSREESQLKEESRRNSNVELSINTREELSRLVLAGELDCSMIKYMVKSAKLEKQAKTAQALLNTVIVENQALKMEHEKLHCEIRTMNQQVIQMEKEIRISTSKSPELLQEEEKLPGDWVRVENEKKQGAGDELTPSGSTTLEVDLRRKVDKLKQHAKELLRANAAWDNHCKQLSEEHELTLGALKKKLQMSLKEVEKYKASQEKEQMQDNTLMNERDDAVRKYHEERQRRRESEQQWDIQRQRAEQLDLEVKEQAEIISALTEVRNSLVSLRQSNRPGGEGNTEIEVLRQQVTIYKDDFDNERRDRERAQAEKASMEQQLKTANLTIGTQRDQLRQKEQELGRVIEQKRELQHRLSEAKVELRRIQMLLGSQPPTAPPYPCVEQPSRIAYPPYQPPPYPATEPRNIPGGIEHSWSCRTCTYDNPDVRITCEMCGAARYRGQHVPTTVENMDTQCIHVLSPHGLDQCDAAGADTNTSQSYHTRHPTQYGLGSEGLDTDITQEKMETPLQ